MTDSNQALEMSQTGQAEESGSWSVLSFFEHDVVLVILVSGCGQLPIPFIH